MARRTQKVQQVRKEQDARERAGASRGVLRAACVCPACRRAEPMPFVLCDGSPYLSPTQNNITRRSFPYTAPIDV